MEFNLVRRPCHELGAEPDLFEGDERNGEEEGEQDGPVDPFRGAISTRPAFMTRAKGI